MDEKDGQGSKSGRLLSWPEMNQGVSVARRLDRRLFIVGYLQFVARRHLQTALCSAATVASKRNKRLSVSGMAAPLESGSVKPSGN